MATSPLDTRVRGSSPGLMQHTSAHREDEQLVLHLSQQLEQQETRIHLLNQLQVFVAEHCSVLHCVAAGGAHTSSQATLGVCCSAL